MTWAITYYDASVQEEILAMPAGFLGRYLRYSDKMEIYGPDLGMPHTSKKQTRHRQENLERHGGE